MDRRSRNTSKFTPASSSYTLDWIQVAGIGLIAIVVVGLAWWISAGSEASSPLQWSSPPPMMIDPARSYEAKVSMEDGQEFTIVLRPDKAPTTVNNFVFLAREGFYDGVTFHRVLDGFMAQAGDPSGTGAGGPGYKFPDEESDLVFNTAGVVAMANAGPDTNGSQFFITFGPQPQLNGGYTIFGQVTGGMDTVNSLTRRDPQASPAYEGDRIESVTIIEE
jgi:peptidylprolyl isomerase